MAIPDAVQLIMDTPTGRQSMTHYKFVKSGDEIPMHSHNYYHSCYCISGALEIYDDDGKVKTVFEGEYAEFYAGRKHGIRATQDKTQTIHILEIGVDPSKHDIIQ